MEKQPYIKKYKFEKLLLLPIKFLYKKKQGQLPNDFSLKNNDFHFIIFYTGALGDCVLSTYFIGGLKNRFPNSKITFVSIPGAIGFLKCIKEIDFLFPSTIFTIRKLSRLFSLKAIKLFLKEHASVYRHTKNSKGTKVLISLNRMDSILGVYKTCLVSSFIRNDLSIGLNTNERGFFFDCIIHDPGNLVEHITETWRGFFKAFNRIQPLEQLTSTINSNIANYTKSWSGKKYCVIHTGGGSDITESKWINKRWDIYRFYQLAQWLVDVYDYEIIFVGMLQEKDSSFDSIQQQKGYKDLYGKTTIPELISVIKNASIYVGNDSGIAHIASFLNVKTFIIWGYASYIDYMPISDNTTLIRLPLKCAPCLPFFDNRECKGTSWEIKCVKDIELPLVQKIITELHDKKYFKLLI